MASDVYMVITDQNGSVLASEVPVIVFDPYLKRNVTSPFELSSFTGETEQTYAISATGGGAGKVTFDPFTVTRQVDALSQILLIRQATGALFKFVDILVVRAGGADPSGPIKPYLSYRLGSVGISDIAVQHTDEIPTETVRFEYGQLQIGYQVQNPDGTYGTFNPVGWDRVKNIKI